MDKKSGPLIAMKLRLISRKSLGGIQTNLDSQVLDKQGNVMNGLYAIGEAAGFGGGGASGFKSLEGTFLSGCILTARAAAQSINSSI
jgi:predicted oxidoreductase